MSRGTTSTDCPTRPPCAAVATPSRLAAWILCLAVLAAGTVGGFCGVAAWARAAFDDHHRLTPPVTTRIGEVVGSVAMEDDIVVRQEFDVMADGLAGLRVRTVTWGATPDDYGCDWSLVEVAADGRAVRTIRSGTLAPAAATDWGYADLRFEPIPDSCAARYALRITTGPGRRARPLGLPLFSPVDAAVDVAVRRRHGGPPLAVPRSAVLDVRLVHAAGGA